MSDTLGVYRVLEATITRGPDAGATIRGPLLMVQTSRIQLYGYLYAGTGQPILVVGTLRGQRLDLRLFIARSGGAQSLALVGKGALAPVVGGWPGAESLIGSGTLSGPRQGDTGHWTTTEPSTGPRQPSV